MSMLELFRMEAEGQVQVLTASLLALERSPTAADQLEACMRAAHSLKGAARIVGLGAGVKIAHVMEDCFVAAQRGALVLQQQQVNLLLKGVDLLTQIGDTPEAQVTVWEGDKLPEIDAFLRQLEAALADGGDTAGPPVAASTPVPGSTAPAQPQAPSTSGEAGGESAEAPGRALRVTADNLNRLLALAGEFLVESRLLKPFADSMLRLKRLQQQSGRTLQAFAESLPEPALNEHGHLALAEAQEQTRKVLRQLSRRFAELENFERRFTILANRLYEEAQACRMRPLADGVKAYPRMVRDLAQLLGKRARLDIVGEATQVDRDILERLDAPLGHLLRNALDHGIETPEVRLAQGKPAEGTVVLEARHSAGMLLIVVADDGRGVELEQLRATVVARGLITTETAGKLSEAELLEFLFLPGFSTKGTVSEISGRGVGLDVVHDMIRQVRGTIRVQSIPGQGMRFTLQLPLSLSVVRTLLVEVGGEPYALPLAYIVRTLRLPRENIELLEGRQHFNLDGHAVGLVSAHQVLRGDDFNTPDDALQVIVVGDASTAYGLVVDRFLGERELVVQPLDPRLGKVKDIAAGALMEDGTPVLIVDVEDLLRSLERIVTGGRISSMRRTAESGSVRKRVLVADDSLTIRELERKLLDNAGYEVEVAVDGMDAWNALRRGQHDLLVTDIDMPRMDGIELVTLTRRDPQLKSLPVIIVSYKDREEDRRRGLEAGADYYLTKGSFHDASLLQAVVDLIGEASG